MDKNGQRTSPNLDPQASRFPQKTQVSQRQGPSFPVHIDLQELQHSSEVLNLNSEPHFTAEPQSSKFSIPLQHPPTFFSPTKSNVDPIFLNSETEPLLVTAERKT